MIHESYHYRSSVILNAVTRKYLQKKNTYSYIILSEALCDMRVVSVWETEVKKNVRTDSLQS